MQIQMRNSWLVLMGLQAVVAAILFSAFLAGKFYFAYLDIGSDSYFQVVPYALHLARTMAHEGFTGWSFQIGLGGPTMAMSGDLTNLAFQLVGPERVLSARIEFYLLKMVLGGAFFWLLVQNHVKRWESAVISALAYTFCGFMVINGQWDVEATAFVFYPLVLWAVVKYLRTGNLVAVPAVIASALLFGVFFVSLGVFLVYCCLMFVACSDSPKIAIRQWIGGVLPLTVIGYLLAAPYLSPVIFQLMDSSRVNGGDSLIQNILTSSLSVNDWSLVLAEIGGLFHKDIFGVGSAYHGYWNYLEGPGFFFGVTLFLLIPQLLAGPRAHRRLVIFAALGLVAYFIFPFFRYATMGFAAPYFRVSTLWIAILGLVLAAKALDRVLVSGINGRLLAIGLAVYCVLLSLVLFGAKGPDVWEPHLVKISMLVVLSSLVQVLAHRKVLTEHRLPLLLMALVVIEIVVIARPSYVEGRTLASPQLRAYDDGTPQALAAIRKLDAGVFRIEKDYDSVSLADALAQDYMGIKSYSLHSRGMVDFHIGTALIEPSSTSVNFTNWLPNAGTRFMLNSLLGVKYIISRDDLQWPGFLEVGNTPADLHIYRNEMALPFGIVQTTQLTKETFARISVIDDVNAETIRDIALFNSVVVDQLIPGHGNTFPLDALMQSNAFSLQEHYFSPALTLQKTGLHITQFASNHITGSIAPTQAGILVFSIPFNAGWSLRLDGIETPMFRANFGMLAAPVLAGSHFVELTFRIPGQDLGLCLGALGLGLLMLGVFLRRRAAPLEVPMARSKPLRV